MNYDICKGIPFVKTMSFIPIQSQKLKKERKKKNTKVANLKQKNSTLYEFIPNNLQVKTKIIRVPRKTEPSALTGWAAMKGTTLTPTFHSRRSYPTGVLPRRLTNGYSVGLMVAAEMANLWLIPTLTKPTRIRQIVWRLLCWSPFPVKSA